VNRLSVMCLGVLVSAVSPLHAQSGQPEAWWEICDFCMTDSDFADRAAGVPGHYLLVYVTNRNTSETRRFRREISAGGIFSAGTEGTRRTITIETIPEPIPAAEQQIFFETVQGANAIAVTISSNDLLFNTPGSRDSVVGDIQHGAVDTRLFSALRTLLIGRGLAGAADQVSQSVRGVVRKIGFNLTASSQDNIRTVPLQVVVEYPNGSSINVVLSANFTEWSELAVVDDAGTLIPVEDPNDPVGTEIDREALDARELVFETGNPQFVENFLEAVERLGNGPGGQGTTSCGSRLTAAGMWVLICPYTP